MFSPPLLAQVTTEPVAELGALSIGPDQLALKASVDARLALQARGIVWGSQMEGGHYHSHQQIIEHNMFNRHSFATEKRHTILVKPPCFEKISETRS